MQLLLEQNFKTKDKVSGTNLYVTEVMAAMLIWSLSKRPGAFLDCTWKRRHPDMEGSCEYIE